MTDTKNKSIRMADLSLHDADVVRAYQEDHLRIDDIHTISLCVFKNPGRGLEPFGVQVDATEGFYNKRFDTFDDAFTYMKKLVDLAGIQDLDNP